jgi:rSAM/selenodomain-associated transferase 2/rSAM/selenodomain-associated transferase 1
MTERIVNLVRHSNLTEHACVEIWFTGCSESQIRDWLGPEFPYRPQAGGDLGERELAAFQTAFREGSQKTLIIGTDILGLTVPVIEEALRQLGPHDLVLGPAIDGGYYLIGLKQPHADLFTEIPWGTDKVLNATLEAADRLGLPTALLQPLADVDRPEDLSQWHEALQPSMAEFLRPVAEAARPLVSVVIPTLNEESNLSAALKTAKSAHNSEIIVVDGGSSDATVRIAESWGVQVISASRGRARQMNEGAARASGEILLFLHADTRLPKGWTDTVIRTLQMPDTFAGAFLLGIDGNSRSLRLIEWLANLRSRLMGMPYGDQAIFLRKDIFTRVGGFPEIPLMEDFELVSTLKTFGKVRIAPTRVLTSARRWRELGVLKTTLINQLVILGHMVGLPIGELHVLQQVGSRPGQLTREIWRLLVRSGILRKTLNRKIINAVSGYRSNGVHRKPHDGSDSVQGLGSRVPGEGPHGSEKP